MRSAISVTLEMDDMAAAVEELVSGVREQLGDFDRSAAAFVVCDADIDAEELSRGLHEALGCDVMGITGIGTFDLRSGSTEAAAMLGVITGDDIDLVVGSTGLLDPENLDGEVRAAYSAARAKAPSDPKLILLFAPFITGVPCNGFVESFDAASSGVPIFGGIASDHYDCEYITTFVNGEVDDRSARFILLCGDAEPVFAVRHHFTEDIYLSGVVTKAEGCTVYEIDGRPLDDFLPELKELGTDMLASFLDVVFIVDMPDKIEGEEPLVRVLRQQDKERHCGIFSSVVPVGARIRIATMMREDIEISCRQTMELAMQRAAARGREACLILIPTCIARYAMMGNDKGLEADIVREMLKDAPKELNAAGAYGMGEFCPTVDSEGRMHNRSHHKSLVVCVL